MAPTFSLTGKRNARLIGQLYAWWKKHQADGEIVDSNAGFTLPNKLVRIAAAKRVPSGKLLVIS